MRFIDADALVNVVETARKKARTLTGMDFVMVTENQPTIDAIPVEWIVKQTAIAKELGDMSCYYAFRRLVGVWQKEQETR